MCLLVCFLLLFLLSLGSLLFFLKNPAPPEISPLPLHDALPISAAHPRAPPLMASERDRGTPAPPRRPRRSCRGCRQTCWCRRTNLACRKCPGSPTPPPWPDRKSTRLNSSHDQISYAVFCLKKKK